MSDPIESLNHNTIKFNKYVVMLFDVLGTARELDGLRGTPTNSQELARWNEIATKSLRTVEMLRRQINSRFESFKDKKSYAEYVHNLEMSKHPDHNMAYYNEFTIQHIADTVIVISPLTNCMSEITTTNTLLFVSTVTAVMILALGRGVPVRGAIDIGYATKMNDGDYYGPVLSNVHRLESKVAKYPRVIISNDACDYLKNQAEQVGQTWYNIQMRAASELCASMIVKDYDGMSMVDYLGEGSRKHYEDDTYPAICKSVKQAHQFIESEHRRFIEAEDYELMQRYGLLRQYFDERAPNWK